MCVCVYGTKTRSVSPDVSAAVPIQTKTHHCATSISGCRKHNSNSTDKKQDNVPPLSLSLTHAHTLPSMNTSSHFYVPGMDYNSNNTFAISPTGHTTSSNTFIYNEEMRRHGDAVISERGRERTLGCLFHSFVPAWCVQSDEFSGVVSSGLSRFSFISNTVNALSNYGSFRWIFG